MERNKITSGTTWHTAGLIWRQRPNDVETTILTNTYNIIKEVGADTDMDPGWINNGGIFIAHNEVCYHFFHSFIKDEQFQKKRKHMIN